jgi:(R,R)-butanediol dehydrogenase / meso-butanediol dehydrogenase / diacetyl reductase
MRAAVLTDTHDLEVVDVPDPSPGPGELVLQVTACGICGSDLKLRPAMPAGLVMGHEFCGEIVAVGEDVAPGWRQGQHVTALPIFGCGLCLACVAGEPAHCEEADLVGVGGSAGGFAEYVRVDQRETVALPESIDPTLGALVEPLAVGLHAVERAHIRSGNKVLVVGAGPVGLSVITWAARSGASELVVSDPSAVRREAAEQFGATRTIDPEAEPIEAGYDVVIECVGLPGMTDVCVGAAGRHGHVIIAGVCTKPDPYVPIAAVVKELTMDFVVYYTRREFFAVTDALAQGAVDAASFVSKRVGLEGANDAFTELIDAKDQRKILVQPSLS